MKRAALEKYYAKRAEFSWPLVAPELDGVEHVVAIPVLAEKDHLFQTLDSLAANDPEEVARTLVICVVNNRAEPLVKKADIENNLETLATLEAMRQSSPLRLAYVDAASPGRAFPDHGGVGLARKMGLDWGLRVLEEQGAACPVLLCLDADTLVEPNYLAAVRAHFHNEGSWAGIVEYAHPIEGDTAQQAAIINYELFLRYHEIGLRYAASPYAFATIGSTITLRPEAYVAVAGMNARQAGEDFYFLQQLAKTGRVDNISATRVYPSPRASHRVPFGTGQRVRRFLDDDRDEYVLYHPDSYRVLKDWLRTGTEYTGDGDGLLEKAAGIHAELAAFLSRNAFSAAWDRLRANSRTADQLRSQFHGWFDGFRTLKLIHHLRDTAFPPADMFASIATLLTWIDRPCSGTVTRKDIEAQKKLLDHLRTLCM